MSDWKQGWVRTMTRGDVRLFKGQRWGYFKPLPDGSIPVVHDTGQMTPIGRETVLTLEVVSTSASGEVVLRPTDPQKAEQTFPLQESTFKGKPLTTRNCPFMWVDERQAKGSKGEYQPGDLLCHEAWDVWKDMHPHS